MQFCILLIPRPLIFIIFFTCSLCKTHSIEESGTTQIGDDFVEYVQVSFHFNVPGHFFKTIKSALKKRAEIYHFRHIATNVGNVYLNSITISSVTSIPPFKICMYYSFSFSLHFYFSIALKNC